MNIERKLTGIMVKVKVDGKILKKDFSDCTVKQMKRVLKNKRRKWIKDLAIDIALKFRCMGDKLDIIGVAPPPEEKV